MNLKAPRGNEVRPTADRIKENVFNIISFELHDTVFLDLFAGTGQIGLEALSRGAAYCVFVEKNKDALQVLKENISKSGFDNYRIVQGDALRYLDNCDMKFDLIYVDPPYKSDLYETVARKIMGSGILKDGSKIIVEHDFNVVLNAFCDILDRYKAVKYGMTALTFFRKRI